MTSSRRQILQWTAFTAFASSLRVPRCLGADQRNEAYHFRGRFNTNFFYRHNEAFRIGAAIHFAHGRQHDVLLKTPLSDHAAVDDRTHADFEEFTRKLKAKTEPKMDLYAPYTGRAMWDVFRAIDWTHAHHEVTYDILSDAGIPWREKASYTKRASDYYLRDAIEGIARSCAPLDVTMRRAGVMMKPYFSYFRNYYPKCNNYFYAAHWWHPVIYEAQMIGGNGPAQDQMVKETDRTFFEQVLSDPPLRMLLSRENMPRYSRMSPESANIFDNLHMFHGIIYDLMSYDPWTIEEKRAEAYRVIKAMSYQPGDEKLARKFRLPHPDMDPRVYEPWMKTPEGEMGRIMTEMHEEMMPLMMPDGATTMPAETHERMKAQMKMKLTPGVQDGEIDGSLHDAMMKVMPNMKMTPQMQEGLKPGKTPQMMIDAMLAGWNKKYGDLPDIEPWPMDREPNGGVR
ncbi:MAG: hypothetical protein QM770_17590 [Tepidisphaeraceae bacterium]